MWAPPALDRVHLSCPWRVNRVPGYAALADIGWILHAVVLLLFNNGVPTEKGRFFTEDEGLQAYTGYNDMQNRGPHGIAGVPLSLGNEGPPGVAILPDTRKNYPPKNDADSACLPSPPLASLVAFPPVPRLAQHRPVKPSLGPHGKARPLRPLVRRVAGAERPALAGKQRAEGAALDSAAQGQGAVDRRAARPQQEGRPPRPATHHHHPGGAVMRLSASKSRRCASPNILRPQHALSRVAASFSPSLVSSSPDSSVPESLAVGPGPKHA